MRKWKKNLNRMVEEKLPPQDESVSLKEKGGVEIHHKGQARPYVNGAKRVWKGVGIGLGSTLAVLVLIPVVAIVIAGTEVQQTYRPIQRNYSLHEQQQIREDTFQRMNSFSFPSDSSLRPVSQEYQEAVNAFSYQTYSFLKKEENAFFSPLSFYLHLDTLSHGTSDASLSESFDRALGLSQEKREANFVSAFLTNRDPGGEGSSHVEMNQLFFLDRDFDYQSTYLDYLTSIYCEAYSLAMENKKDQKKMTDLVNSKVSYGLLSPDDLLIDSYTCAFFFTTLDFFGSWGFNKKGTTQENFYPSSGDPYLTSFMHDTFYGSAYDYGDYFSFRISFRGGYSMQILTPKERGGDVDAIVSSRNFLVEDPKHIYKADIYGEEKTNFLIEVALPRFQTSSSLSFDDLYPLMGLSRLLDKDGFLDEVVTQSPLYIQETKQKNRIYWDESGTTASSITWSGIAPGSAGPTQNGLAFQMDSPFLYVIRDRNDLPLYVGRVDRP